MNRYQGVNWSTTWLHEINLFGTPGAGFMKSLSFGLSLGLKSETFVSAEFLAQMDFTKGGSAESGLKS